MICSICGKESSDGKIYTLSPEVSKMINIKRSTYWICDDCLANPVRRFADSLLEMWDVFPMTSTQKINNICEMFRGGGVRLPRGVSLEDMKDELRRRAS